MERKVFELGDIVLMKKPHPCGTNEMEIIRMGMDIRIKCTGCQHSVLIPVLSSRRTSRKCSVQRVPGQEQRGPIIKLAKVKTP